MPAASAPFKAKAPFHARGTGGPYHAHPLDFINPPFANHFGCLAVSPASTFNIIGHEGGPFTPDVRLYTLTNIGGTTMDWTLTISETWLTADILSGTITPGESTIVTVTVAADAIPTDPSPYTALLTFTNTTNGCGNTSSSARLIVTPVLAMVVDSRFKSGTATMIGYSEYWDLNPPNDCITAVPFPSHPAKKYRTQTLGGGTFLQCQHIAGGVPNPCSSAVDNVNWKEISGSNNYNISTGAQTNTQLLTDGRYTAPPNTTCFKQGAITGTSTLNPGAIGRPPDYVPFLYCWGQIEIGIPHTIGASTPTFISWTGDPAYCYAAASESGEVHYTLSNEDTELDAINRMIGALSYSAYATAAALGDAYSSRQARDPDVWPSDFDFLTRYTQYRLTRSGLTPSTAYTGNAKIYRRLYGTTDPWVFVSNVPLAASTDGAGLLSITDVIPTASGYSYSVWNAVVYA